MGVPALTGVATAKEKRERKFSPQVLPLGQWFVSRCPAESKCSMSIIMGIVGMERCTE